MSLDAKLRRAIYTSLAEWPTCAKLVVTYRVAPYRQSDMPILDVEVGGFEQTSVGGPRPARP